MHPKAVLLHGTEHSPSDRLVPQWVVRLLGPGGQRPHLFHSLLGPGFRTVPGMLSLNAE